MCTSPLVSTVYRCIIPVIYRQVYNIFIGIYHNLSLLLRNDHTDNTLAIVLTPSKHIRILRYAFNNCLVIFLQVCQPWLENDTFDRTMTNTIIYNGQNLWTHMYWYINSLPREVYSSITSHRMYMYGMYNCSMCLHLYHDIIRNTCTQGSVRGILDVYIVVLRCRTWVNIQINSWLIVCISVNSQFHFRGTAATSFM